MESLSKQTSVAHACSPVHISSKQQQKILIFSIIFYSAFMLLSKSIKIKKLQYFTNIEIKRKL